MAGINENLVLKFYNKIELHNNDRFRSFEHCYSFFRDINETNSFKSNLDLASLHLAFYLASWGMYRGSSFLLQYDYKIFQTLVPILFKEQYSDLWSLDELLTNENKNHFIDLILSLENELSLILKEFRSKWLKFSSQEEVTEPVSSILTTKILMGTFGCVPAYDRFFMDGIGQYNSSNKTHFVKLFGKKSLNNLFDFYLENKSNLLNLRNKIKSKTDLDYPLMKIIDSYFWQSGFEVDELKRKRN